MSHTSDMTRPVSRWQGGEYHLQETQRLQALEGVELASFARRAAALAIDFVAVIVVFVALAIPIAMWYKRHQIEAHLSFNPFENWYSTVLPVVYFGLLVWLTNGRTLGKWLTGIRIVSLGHEHISLWHSVERALGLLDFLEISALRDRWGAELSYGQRKLVEIARALMLEPRVMLLDEPFAGINPRLQNRIVDRLQALRAQGLTLFFIDHEMRIVLEICDDLYVLAEGKVIAHGDADAIRGDEQVKAAYF